MLFDIIIFYKIYIYIYIYIYILLISRESTFYNKRFNYQANQRLDIIFKKQFYNFYLLLLLLLLLLFLEKQLKAYERVF